MIIDIILSLAVFLNLLLGYLSIIQDRKSWQNRFFSLLCLFSAFWTFTNFMTGIYATPFWLKSTYSFGSLVASTGLVWTLFLTDKSLKLKKVAIVYAFALFFFVASFFDGFIAKNYEAIYPGGAFAGEPGGGLIIYAVFFSINGILILYNLFSGYSASTSGEEKNKFKFIIYGAFGTLGVTFLTSLFLPLFSIYQFSGVDSIGVLILLVCISYTIIKYHLLNIKVITTEIFIFVLWILLIARTVLSEKYQDFIINGGLLVTVVIVGILLIRIREVNQREKMEKMAEQIKKAYEVEKKANEELEALGAVKNQFLMTIQHHLRTPLTSMRGYADLLLAGSYGKAPKKINEVIVKFEASTTSMIKMVNDFLDITQFQLGKKTIALKDGVSLYPIVEEISKDSELQATNKGIYLKLEIPEGECLIKADESKLKAAIVNILDNSVKYTKEGGVLLRAIIKNEKVLITIKDTGMGISKERLPKLFSSTFERGEDAKKAFSEGRGIGLYLSRQVVEAHGGKIWAESEGEGKGSTFFIELPCDIIKQ